MKNIPVTQLRSLLVDPGIVDGERFDLLVQLSEEENTDLVDVIVDAGVIHDEQLGKLIAEEMGYRFVNLKQERIDQTIFQQIPEEMATAHRVVAVGESRGKIKVGMVDPADFETIHLVEKKFGKPIQVYSATPQGMRFALLHYRSDLKTAFDYLIKQSEKDEKEGGIGHDQVVKRTVDLLMQYGRESGTSDIHVEPARKTVVVRFRVDGVLQKVLRIPKPLYSSVLARIKILAKMRTDEHRAAQDGKFSFTSPEQGRMDVRVSIVPTGEGENIVMRLLASDSKQFALEELGFRGDDLVKLKDAIAEPHGMILVTGPTGSGKTTTLYAVLKLLNEPTVNIATIEDPVEYSIDGVTQIQVDAKSQLTFAKGLRAIVRQDPDIIMVGEIRDEETSDIAVNSALTGHLVLSTLHTNDAPTTLPRLLDMSVEPFLIASTLNIVIAQRLVRKICRSCIVSYEPDEKTISLIKRSKALQAATKKYGHKNIKELRLYKGKGCNVCMNTGFTGRIGVFEVLRMSDPIRDAIMARKDADQIREIAIQEGMSSMLEDGVMKALNGVTTLEEVFRVAHQ